VALKYFFFVIFLKFTKKKNFFVSKTLEKNRSKQKTARNKKMHEWNKQLELLPKSLEIKTARQDAALLSRCIHVPLPADLSSLQEQVERMQLLVRRYGYLIYPGFSTTDAKQQSRELVFSCMITDVAYQKEEQRKMAKEQGWIDRPNPFERLSLPELLRAVQAEAISPPGGDEMDAEPDEHFVPDTPALPVDLATKAKTMGGQPLLAEAQNMWKRGLQHLCQLEKTQRACVRFAQYGQLLPALLTLCEVVADTSFGDCALETALDLACMTRTDMNEQDRVQWADLTREQKIEFWQRRDHERFWNGAVPFICKTKAPEDEDAGKAVELPKPMIDLYLGGFMKDVAEHWQPKGRDAEGRKPEIPARYGITRRHLLQLIDFFGNRNIGSLGLWTLEQIKWIGGPYMAALYELAQDPPILRGGADDNAYNNILGNPAVALRELARLELRLFWSGPKKNQPPEEKKEEKKQPGLYKAKFEGGLLAQVTNALPSCAPADWPWFLSSAYSARDDVFQANLLDHAVQHQQLAVLTWYFQVVPKSIRIPTLAQLRPKLVMIWTNPVKCLAACALFDA